MHKPSVLVVSMPSEISVLSYSKFITYHLICTKNHLKKRVDITLCHHKNQILQLLLCHTLQKFNCHRNLTWFLYICHYNNLYNLFFLNNNLLINFIFCWSNKIFNFNPYFFIFLHILSCLFCHQLKLLSNTYYHYLIQYIHLLCFIWCHIANVVNKNFLVWFFILMLYQSRFWNRECTKYDFWYQFLLLYLSLY